MKKLLIAGLIGIWANGAMAHSPLESTMPLDETVVAEVPTEIRLDFKGKIRLTRVAMTHDNHPSVDLDLSDHDGFIKGYAIPIEAMGSGAYMIVWRGLGIDGHAMNGTFSFIVQ